MVSEYIKKLLKDKARLKKWKRITLALSCVVVFCVVYALTLPAITLEGKTICGMEEHTHTEECYQDEKLVCDKEEHQHTEDCYEKEEEQPVEEENTQQDITESSEEVETVAEPEDNKQDESNEEEQQQESTQVTSEGFDLSANQNNIESVNILYKLNGEWQTVQEGSVSPDSTDIQIKVKYKEISTKDLHEKYNNTLIYSIPDFLRNAQPKGNILDESNNVVGTITVENGRAYLRFYETYLNNLTNSGNTTLKGDFNIEGKMDLSHLDKNNGTATLTTANKTIHLNFESDVIQKFGDVTVEKQYSKDGEEKNGDYIKYTVIVKAGIDGCKNISVVDKFTQN